MNYKIYGIYIIIILIILYFIQTWNVPKYEDYLYGFWTASEDEFCEEAEITSIMMFIGQPESSWGNITRYGYLVISDDICNQSFTMNYRKGWGGLSIDDYRIKPCIEFDESQYWPQDVIIDVDIMNGTMIIHKDGITYARLHKQNEITNAAKAFD